jgi:ABC-type transporter Mla MlaB component
MANWVRVLSMAVCLVLGPNAWAQAPAPELRIAGLTQARRAEIEEAIAREAAVRGVSERALAAAAQAAGAELQASGRFDAEALAEAIIQRIAAQAQTIQELEARLAWLARADDLTVASLVSRARSAINEGQLAEADALLEQAEQSDLRSARAALDQAEMRFERSAATMAARGRIALLQGDYLGAAAHFSRAAETVPENRVEARWQYRLH